MHRPYALKRRRGTSLLSCRANFAAVYSFFTMSESPCINLVCSQAQEAKRKEALQAKPRFLHSRTRTVVYET